MTSSVDRQNKAKSEVLYSPEHLATLFRHMQSDKSLHDVEFVVQNERFSANRCVVAAASPVLRKMLTNGMKETNEREIQLEEVNVDEWRMVLDYSYTARLEFDDIDSALRCLECANRFQFEDLERVISNYLEKNLNKKNYYRILTLTDRTNLVSLRKATMKFVCNNFYTLCFSAELSLMPVFVILEVLNSEKLVVRSEFDVFKAVFRWGVRLGVNDTQTELDAQIATRACELFVKFKLLPDDYTLLEPESCNTRSYSELFECVKFDNMSNNDLRLVVQLCRQLCAEVQKNHEIDLVHLRQFGEKALDKLVGMENTIPNIPTFPYERVPRKRKNEVFTFSHTFSDVQTLISSSGSECGRRSPQFLDETGQVKWQLLVYFRGYDQKTRDRYVSVSLHRDSECGEQYLEHGLELFAEIERGHSTSDSVVISRRNPRWLTPKIMVAQKFMPISFLQRKHKIEVGVAIYRKHKYSSSDGNGPSRSRRRSFFTMSNG